MTRSRTALTCALGAAVAVAVFLSAPTRGLAIQPKGPQPGAARKPKLVGREQDGLTFRKPGTLIYRASRQPRHVDPAALRRRKIEQVTHRARHTRALAAIEPIDTDVEQPLLPPDERSQDPGEPRQERAGVHAWHVLVLLVLAAVVLVAVRWFIDRRR